MIENQHIDYSKMDSITGIAKESMESRLYQKLH